MNLDEERIGNSIEWREYDDNQRFAANQAIVCSMGSPKLFSLGFAKMDGYGVENLFPRVFDVSKSEITGITHWQETEPYKVCGYGTKGITLYTPILKKHYNIPKLEDTEIYLINGFDKHNFTDNVEYIDYGLEMWHRGEDDYIFVLTGCCAYQEIYAKGIEEYLSTLKKCLEILNLAIQLDKGLRNVSKEFHSY